MVRSTGAKDILEFACGTGTVAVGLALEGYDVTGVDYSPGMLELARRKARSNKAVVKFIEADITKVRLERQYDLILCLGNAVPQFRTEQSLSRLFANCRRHLNPGGYFVFQQLNYDRILRERPATFAVDLDRDTARFKQYRYRQGMIDFYVTIVDGSSIPPEVATTINRLKPWTRAALVTDSEAQSDFVKAKALGNYAGERHTANIERLDNNGESEQT